VLLREVRERDEASRAVLAAGRWPDHEIDALVGHLRYEVLDQAATEERLLFPLTGEGLADSRVRGLVDDHVRLRDMTDRRANVAAVEEAGPRPGPLPEVLDALQEFLDRHMREEEAALTPATAAGVESLRHPFRCHLWFPLTEGPVLDLDVLPQDYAHRAALERLGRLPAGEHLLVRAGNELDGLWRLLASRLSGEYGWAYLEERPERWQADATRRAPG
jgi:uncharacterized protein (DUF2249 family)